MSYAKQTDLFLEFSKQPADPKPVNVASVPQRSPFRYPGGKTWFVPTFRKWLKKITTKPKLLVEPFAGGGIISLTALFEELVESAFMLELDEDIAAVWLSVVNGDANWLAKRILDFKLSRESVLSALSIKPDSVKGRAFQTILKNRTFHGGILAEGSGLLKYGENGKGINSRWYPETLAKRFKNLNLIKERITFKCENGLDAILKHAENTNTIFFIDPPYTAGGKKAGKRLYRHCDVDHETLFAYCNKIKGDFLLTYDNADEVRTLARKFSFQMRLIPMTNTHHAKMDELVIGKDLKWMDDLPVVKEPKAGYTFRENFNRDSSASN